MSEHLTPLEVCERLIGPLERIGVICGLDPKAPYHWRRQSVGRRAGDVPSAPHMRALLDWAEANDVPLTAAMLVRGASADTVDALVAARQERAA